MLMLRSIPFFSLDRSSPQGMIGCKCGVISGGVRDARPGCPVHRFEDGAGLARQILDDVIPQVEDDEIAAKLCRARRALDGDWERI